MLKMMKRVTMRLMAVIIVVCFFLPLNSSAAVMEVNESGVQSAPLEILKKTKDVLNTTASEYLYIYENSATAALEYARPGTLSINLYIMTGFGNTRTYLDTKGGNTIGGASCSIGTQDVIGSKLLYARGEYTVKAYEGTSSMTWNDSIEWGILTHNMRNCVLTVGKSEVLFLAGLLSNAVR